MHFHSFPNLFSFSEVAFYLAITYINECLKKDRKGIPSEDTVRVLGEMVHKTDTQILLSFSFWPSSFFHLFFLLSGKSLAVKAKNK